MSKKTYDPSDGTFKKKSKVKLYCEISLPYKKGGKKHTVKELDLINISQKNSQAITINTLVLVIEIKGVTSNLRTEPVGYQTKVKENQTPLDYYKSVPLDTNTDKIRLVILHDNGFNADLNQDVNILDFIMDFLVGKDYSECEIPLPPFLSTKELYAPQSSGNSILVGTN